MSSSAIADLPIPVPIQQLAALVHKANGVAWLVGGCVRDHLMGLPVKDWDVEVHGIEVQKLEALLRQLGKVNAVGRSFGVLKLRPTGTPYTDPEIDVSLPRRDSNAGPGHKGISVVGDPWMPLDEAVRRRDLTINALLVDVRTHRLEDRIGGLDDIQAGRLRAVDPASFLDDPLRALRVVQFAARTGFTADPALVELCRRAPLHELPAERIQGEWAKLLLKGTHIVHALELADEAALTQRVFPKHHPGSVAALERAVALRSGLEAGPAWTLMLSVWMHADTQNQVEDTLDRLWIHKVGRYAVRREVMSQIAHLNAPVDSDSALRHLSVHVEIDIALRIRAALQPDHDWHHARSQATQLGVLHQKLPLLLQGRHFAALGVPKGPAMGKWVRAAYQAQLDGLFNEETAALQWAEQAVSTGQPPS